MKNYIKIGLILMTFTLISAFVVAFIYTAVKPYIDNAEFNSKLKAIKTVLKDNNDNYLIKNIPENSQQLSALVWKSSENDVLYTDSTNAKVYSPVYKIEENGKNIYIMTVSGIGFGGDVKSVVSFVSQENDIYLNKIEVIDYSQETPGLGARIVESAVKARFSDIPKSGLEKTIKVNKDAGVTYSKDNLDQAKANGVIQLTDIMTGATITPRGTVKSLNIAVEFLKKEGVM
ncbi:MAG TPA: RnfABCDGE type electron transport complex subunit G [Tepiditoga sp.]|nr:RnfABCDGE type electron transport complex subunit G [Thermotogota bacterium]HOO73847.1 RnfABCDGE type electron transport complex subunit G [Tepiditoga sp.]